MTMIHVLEGWSYSTIMDFFTSNYIYFWNLSVYGNAIESMSGTNSGKGDAEQLNFCL